MNFLEYYRQTESFKIPELLLRDLLLDPSSLIEAYLCENPDLSNDELLKDFQLNDASRDPLKQDFTPPEIAKLSANLLPKDFKTAVDLCSGTGSLIIQLWNINPNAFYHCEEYSERTIPFLLFNLCVRNISSEVLCGDSLIQEYKAVYRLTKGAKFSKIEIVNYIEPLKYDVVISNPPYSLKWVEVKKECYKYGIAPKKAGDYAFVQYGISLLNDNGTACFILPHGILFRSQREGEIRQNLIKDKMFNAVIGLPENCFMCTSIPVACLVFKAHSDNILVIDAKKEFTKQGKINRLENIDKIVKTYQDRTAVDKFSAVASFEDIETNDFNLNIPRYVDTFEVAPVPPLTETLNELFKIDNQIKETNKQIGKSLAELTGFSKEEEEAVEKWAKILKSGVL